VVLRWEDEEARIKASAKAKALRRKTTFFGDRPRAASARKWMAQNIQASSTSIVFRSSFSGESLLDNIPSWYSGLW
jgi:hypothetical protein